MSDTVKVHLEHRNLREPGTYEIKKITGAVEITINDAMKRMGSYVAGDLVNKETAVAMTASFEVTVTPERRG